MNHILSKDFISIAGIYSRRTKKTTLTMWFWRLVGAAVVYAFGLFGVTMFGNVPLNEMLHGFAIENATPADLAAKRLAFEGTWNFWHLIRTISVVISLALVLVTCIMNQEKAPDF